jgi:tetratricopeptide (TPR) repeat protein
MAEALEYYEQGDREAALGALSRLEILDDQNEAGKTFAAHIRVEMEEARAAETAESSTEVPFEPADEAERSAAPDSVSGTHPTLESVGSEMNHQPMDLGAGDAAAPKLGLGDVLESGAAGLSEIEIPEVDPREIDPLLTDRPAVPKTAKSSVAPPSKWLMIAAASLFLVGGTFLALQFFGGGPSTDATEATDLAVPPPLARNDPSSTTAASSEPGATTDPQQTADTPPTPAVVDRGAIDRVMDRGDAQFEAGEFAAAVLAYDEALQLDPENEVAKRRLQEAGDLFREEQASLQQRSSAIQAFNDGDFRNALRIFYRIPPVDEAERARFMRYRLNGWYNMGLGALKAGDCRLARSHMKEARSIDALDPGLPAAMDLTSLCFEGNTQAYFDTVRGLRYRGLDD